MVEVVAGFIHVDDKILIAKRTFGSDISKDKWEFPGGKVQEGESDELALKREIMEEMKVEIDVRRYLCDDTQKYPERTIHLKLYECFALSNNILINDEHSEYKLVSFEEIGNYDLVPADKRLYDVLKGE